MHRCVTGCRGLVGTERDGLRERRVVAGEHVEPALAHRGASFLGADPGHEIERGRKRADPITRDDGRRIGVRPSERGTRERCERDGVGGGMTSEEPKVAACPRGRARAVEQEGLPPLSGALAKPIDGHHVRDLLRILERHANRRCDLGELGRREVVGRPPYEREHAADAGPERVDGGIDIAQR